MVAEAAPADLRGPAYGSSTSSAGWRRMASPCTVRRGEEPALTEEISTDARHPTRRGDWPIAIDHRLANSVSVAAMLVPVFVPFMVMVMVITMSIPTSSLIHRWGVNDGRTLVILGRVVVRGGGLVKTWRLISHARLVIDRRGDISGLRPNRSWPKPVRGLPSSASWHCSF